MNISAFTIYLWQLADRLIGILPGFSIPVGIATLILVPVVLGSSHESAHYAARVKKGCLDEEEAARSAAVFFYSYKFLKLGAGLNLFFGALQCLVPSSNTIAMMVVIPEIAHSKAVQTDLPDIYNAAVSALKAAIIPEKK